MTTATEYKHRVSEAVERYYQAYNPVHEGLERYPADVVEVLKVVCELWHLRAPNTKKSKAYWIESARELLDACGEFGTDVLHEYRSDFEAYMNEHRGVAMHTVEGPGSLVKMCRDKARQMREAAQASSFSAKVQKSEYAAWINR